MTSEERDVEENETAQGEDMASGEGQPRGQRQPSRGGDPRQKPDARKGAPGAPSGAEGEDDDEGEDQNRPQRERRERRKNFSNARELMTEELRMRAEESSERLRACLTGSIIVKLRERGEKYLFDWSSTQPRAEVTDQTTGDCVITLSENNLLRVATGELNPQIGMLSDKIAVEGKLSLAVYFFNLIAPLSPH
jgi:putative sterol carrier protein